MSLPSLVDTPEETMTVSPELMALIYQMLSEEPSARGSAAQVAEAFERVAEAAGPEADQPITHRSPVAPAVSESLSASSRPARAWRPGLAAMAGFAAVLAPQGWWTPQRESARQPAQALVRWEPEDQEDAGTSLARQTLMSCARMEQPESSPEGLSAEPPPKPMTGQARHPCKRSETEINGGCWKRPKVSTPPCDERDFEWQGGCYYPVIVPSSPAATDDP